MEDSSKNTVGLNSDTCMVIFGLASLGGLLLLAAKAGTTKTKEEEPLKLEKEEETPKEVVTEEKRPKHPHIVNYSIHEANKWYEIMLPTEGVKAWTLRCREKHDINYCYEPSHSTYITLSKGDVLSEDTAPKMIHAIYVRSPVANVTVEVELWREHVN